ncbi:hypothetical protein DXK94_07485 [Arthrobacter sp. RT-1]|nr:hypothetical protein DXK94_07485 [Arthrobacter sp. RT-1]
MITFDGSIYIHRPVRTVFDVVGTRLFETQPIWEDGIVAIHPLTEGPIRVGTKAVMERLDLGVWRRRTNYQCVAFEQDRLLVFYNDSPGLHVEFRLSVATAGEQGTLLRFVVLATFSGAMRLLEPLAAVMLGRERRKTLRDIKAYVESNPTADTRSRPGVGSQKVFHRDPERTRMKVLASVSLVQLIVQLLAARKAIRDQIPYDIPFAHGAPECRTRYVDQRQRAGGSLAYVGRTCYWDHPALCQAAAVAASGGRSHGRCLHPWHPVGARQPGVVASPGCRDYAAAGRWPCLVCSDGPARSGAGCSYCGV